jgi:hypothetical protein
LVFQQALDCSRKAPNGAEACGAGDTQLYRFMKVGDFERDTLPVVPALRASILSVNISKTTPARERESSLWDPCHNLLHDSCGVMFAAKDRPPAFIVILQEGRLLVKFEKKSLSKPCFGEFLRYTVVMLV